MDVKSPAHSLTHTPAVPKKKNRVEGRVEHGTSKSNIYSLLLLVLHVHCFLVGALVRCFIAAAHDRQIAPPLVWSFVPAWSAMYHGGTYFIW